MHDNNERFVPPVTGVCRASASAKGATTKAVRIHGRMQSWDVQESYRIGATKECKDRR